MFKQYDLDLLQNGKTMDPAAHACVMRHMGMFCGWTVAKTIGLVVAFFGVLLAGSQLAAQNWLWYALLIPLSTYILFSFVGVLHDASHYIIQGKHHNLRWVNDAVGWVSAAGCLICYPTFGALHHEHHLHTNDDEKDPNIQYVNTEGWAFVKTLFSAFNYTRTETVKLVQRTGRTELYRGYTLHWVIIGAWAVGLSFVIGFHNVLLLWIIPAIFSLAAVFFVFARLPHGKGYRAGIIDQRVPVLPLRLQRIATVIARGHNYHLLHHWAPKVPQERYQCLMEELMPLMDAKMAEKRLQAEPVYMQAAE